MATGNEVRPIVIKRIKRVEIRPHGGNWKVAYADFVTAMMAFFLLLWLLSAVTEEQKKGIANYFRPTLAVESSAATFNVLDGQSQSFKGKSNGGTGPAEPEMPSLVVTSQDLAVPAPDSSPHPDAAKPVNIQEAKATVAKDEERKFAEVKKHIEQAIEETPDLRDLKKNLLIEQTNEGLRIQLLDRESVSMFPSGSAVMNEQSKQLLAKVAQAIRLLPNKLSISGHTDATPYVGSGDYSNWELSTDRANASRRVLIAAGIDANRVETVNGKAETDPLINDDPFAPQNRRISIVLLREKSLAKDPADTGPNLATTPEEQTAPPPELVAPE